MKKVFLIASFMIAVIIGVNAQPTEGFSFGAGIRLGLPIGDFGDISSFGVGGELQGEYGFSDMVSGIATSGYTSFFGKSVDIPGYGFYEYDATGYIPILVGARVYPLTNFFIGAQIGYGIFTGNNDSEGGFNYQPQVGYNASRFQLALNYNGVSINGFNYGHIGLTGIFKFGSSQ